MEYCGEVLDSQELEFRMAEARRIGEQHFYIMELDSGQIYTPWIQVRSIILGFRLYLHLYQHIALMS
jgi:hypothetical protein